MGFGCNAAAVVGCRIIDSPRERLIAVLTNSLVPCNGRFPAMIALAAIFFSGGSLGGALILTALVLLGIWATFLASKLLSKTLLRGVPSAFTLELPPYRRPQIGKVIVRSIFDRTLFVLGRAAAVAAPAGAIIWLFANVSVGGATLIGHFSAALNPVGALIGLDGVILLAFILGMPANEIVVPIMLMCYLAAGGLTDYASLSELGGILRANGWTNVTAVCFLLFSLMHWPCSTTLMTIKKETGSVKYTAVAAALPTAFGIVACALVSLCG